MAPQQFLAWQLRCLLLLQFEDFKPTHRPLTLQYPVFVVMNTCALGRNCRLWLCLRLLWLKPQVFSLLLLPLRTLQACCIRFTVHCRIMLPLLPGFLRSRLSGSRLQWSPFLLLPRSILSPVHSMALLVCGETLMMGRRVELWMASKSSAWETVLQCDSLGIFVSASCHVVMLSSNDC